MKSNFLILAHLDPNLAMKAGREIRQFGWDLHLANSPSEVRRLARTWSPQLVLLQSDLGDESGWLTCAKLSLERPEQDIVLLKGMEIGGTDNSFANFVGARALLSSENGIGSYLAKLEGFMSENSSQNFCLPCCPKN